MSTEPEGIPEVKLVDFDLPFVLFLRESLGDAALKEWAKAYAEGQKPLPYSRYAPCAEKPGFMVIGGGFPVFIPPKELAPHYLIRLPQLTVGLRTLRRVNPHRPTIIKGEVPGDRSGRSAFSSVRVMFDLADIAPDRHWDMQLFCELSVAAVNHFIDHYRVLADRPYVGRITMSVIQEFHLTTRFEDGASQTQEFGSGSGPLHGFGGAIDDELDSKLRGAIALPDAPAIEATLDANIRDHLDLEDWRLAVVETAVLFEAWIATFLRGRFAANGVAVADVEAKFVAPNGQPRSVTYLAKTLVLEATGFGFAATAEYSRWESAVRDLRNKIVHGKRFDVTRAEAVDAYQAASAAVGLLATK